MVFKRKIDYDAAKQMRLDGKSYKEIGDVYGVSRQAVYMALDPHKRSTYQRNYYQKKVRKNADRTG